MTLPHLARRPRGRTEPSARLLPDEASPDSRPARLRVGVIGTGRVGAVLGAALDSVGHRVVAVHAVSDASLDRAAALLPGARVTSPAEVLQRSDLVLLTVPDDALSGLVDGLAATSGFRRGQFVVHTSGRHGVGVLEAASEAGALPMALHPAMTFTGTALDLQRLPGTVFAVTAPTALRDAATALVLELGGEPMDVPEDSRPLYHAALAHGANHLVTLVAEAMDLLQAAGVQDPAATLGPLLSASLDNALRSGDAALTGPVARGDADTVSSHIDEIVALSAASAATYVELARRTADRATASGRLRGLAAAQVRAVLRSADPARGVDARGRTAGSEGTSDDEALA